MFDENSKLDGFAAGLNRIHAILEEGGEYTAGMERYIDEAQAYLDGGLEAINWKKVGIASIIAALIAAILAFVAKMKNGGNTTAPVEKVVEQAKKNIVETEKKVVEAVKRSGEMHVGDPKPKHSSKGHIDFDTMSADEISKAVRDHHEGKKNTPSKPNIFENWKTTFPNLPELTNDDVRKIYGVPVEKFNTLSKDDKEDIVKALSDKIEPIMFEKLKYAKDESDEKYLDRGIRLTIHRKNLTKEATMRDSSEVGNLVSFWGDSLMWSINGLENAMESPKNPERMMSSIYEQVPDAQRGTVSDEGYDLLQKMAVFLSTGEDPTKGGLLDENDKKAAPTSEIVNRSDSYKKIFDQNSFAYLNEGEPTFVKLKSSADIYDSEEDFAKLEKSLVNYNKSMEYHAKSIENKEYLKSISQDWNRLTPTVLAHEKCRSYIKSNYPDGEATLNTLDRCIILEYVKVINRIKNLVSGMDRVVKEYKTTVVRLSEFHARLIKFFSSQLV